MPVKADKLKKLVESAMQNTLVCDYCGVHPEDNRLYPVGPNGKVKLLCLDCYAQLMQNIPASVQ